MSRKIDFQESVYSERFRTWKMKQHGQAFLIFTSTSDCKIFALCCQCWFSLYCEWFFPIIVIFITALKTKSPHGIESLFLSASPNVSFPPLSNRSRWNHLDRVPYQIIESGYQVPDFPGDLDLILISHDKILIWSPFTVGSYQFGGGNSEMLRGDLRYFFVGGDKGAPGQMISPSEGPS